MHKSKILLFLFCCSFCAYSAVYEISRDYIKRHNFRTIYDILEKVPLLYGTSYGQTGQHESFQKNGKTAGLTKVYLDSLSINDPLTGSCDFSDISVERIDRITINDVPIDGSGLRIDLYSSRNSIKRHESEVFYNDAFFNHRDLAVSMQQNFTAQSGFRFFAQVTDYMDHRDLEDIDFTAPYEKQDYSASIDLPDYFIRKPVLQGGFFRKKVFEFAADSLKQIEENYFLSIKGTLPVFISGFSNRLTGLMQKKVNNKESYLNSELYSLSANLNWQNQDFAIFSNSQLDYYNFEKIHNQINFSENFGFRWKINSVFQINNENHLAINHDITPENPEHRQHLSTDVNLPGNLLINDYQSNILESLKNNNRNGGCAINASIRLPNGFDFDWRSAYFKGSKGFDLWRYSSETVTNQFAFNNHFEYQHLQNSLSVGLQSEQNYLSNQSEPQYQLNLRNQLNWQDYLDFSIWTNWVLNQKSQPLQSDYSLTSEINYHDLFYKDQLTININLTHRYARFFPGFTDGRAEYLNNLSFKASAKIIDCEIFYGNDNLLKQTYSFNGSKYSANQHYFYQTVPGYNMTTRDEIWGVRWTFYN